MVLDSPSIRRTLRLRLIAVLAAAIFLVCAANASAASISGVVSASTTNLGLGEICINMYNPAAGIVPPVAQGATDATGHYTVGSVPAGSYFVVYFHCPLSGTRQWVQQWWNGHPTFFGATTVTLAAADAVTGMDVTMHPGQAITGTVTTSDAGTDAGAPFCAKVHDTTGTVVGIVPVDVGGTYTLNEPPGDYKVEASPC